MRTLSTLFLAAAISLPAYAQSDSGVYEDTGPSSYDPGASGRADDDGGAPGCACQSAPGAAFGWLVLLGGALVLARRR